MAITRNFQTSVYLMKNDVRSNAAILLNWAKAQYPQHNFDNDVDDYYAVNDNVSFKIFQRENRISCVEIVTGSQKHEFELITVDDDRIRFAAKSSTFVDDEDDSAEYNFTMPEVINDLEAYSGFQDVRQLNRNIINVDNKAVLKELHDLITSPQRIFPVVVFTTTEAYEDSGWSEMQQAATYLLEQSGIYVHVANLQYAMSRQWKELVGDGWDVYGGAIRTYYRDVDFSVSADMYRHPLFTHYKVQKFKYNEASGIQAYMQYLIEKLKNNDCRMRINWRSLGHKFFNAARYTEN